MTTYLFSQIDDGAQIAFNPDADVLAIDSAALSAADFTLTVLPADGGVKWSGDGKTFTLTGVPLSSLGEGTVTFADGSMLVNSCAANGFALDLSGTAHDDLLLGTTGVPTLSLVSQSAGGDAGNGHAVESAVSADGRYVVFSSGATNLTGEADNNGFDDIFLKDLQTGSVIRVSTNADGDEAVDASGWDFGSDSPALSADGRYVAFQSWATNLVEGDTNRNQDVFVKDTQTGEVVLVSTSTQGAKANNTSWTPTLSADGRYVAFASYASNLVAGDTNATMDVFVRDMQTGTVTLVSSSAAGVGGNADADGNGSGGSMISADGRFVVFESGSSNLADGDDNASSDIYVKNLQTGAIVCASTDADGDFADGAAHDASISGDGRYVVFASDAALLHDGHDGAGAIYQRDLQTGELTRVAGAGPEDWRWSGPTSMSSDGRYVVFTSAQALVQGDTNGGDDVYVKDMQTGLIARVSVGSAGEQADYSGFAQVSADGSTIVFSGGPELSGGDWYQQIMAVDNPLVARTLRGGAGDDVYQISNPYDLIVEGAGAGSDTVRSSISLTLADNVESLVLTGNAAIYGQGNAGANRINGNTAANVITGGAGNDTMNGGAGIDTASYAGAAAGVTVDLRLTGVQSTGGAGSDTLVNFESLLGSAYGDRLTGTASANTLDGGAGTDTLTGGAGNDTYVVNSVQDVIVEAAGGGSDTVLASVSLTLAGELENLTLTGAAAINGTGNAAGNILTGNSASNVLNGGTGADTLIGGGGIDTYIVDNAADQVIDEDWDAFNGDTVRSTVSWTLGDQLENLVLGGSSAINGTGNAWDNSITGNAAANIIDGGAGRDTMTGGAGDDIYFVDQYSEAVNESAGGGIDLVKSSISFALGAQVENLTLLAGAEDGSGNELANQLTGNGAANRLDGHAGADTMNGGAGNDTYVVDNAGDRIIETNSGGLEDLVQSSVTFTLAAYVEDLTLTGNAAINGTGNSLGNEIVGNGAANILDGKGGSDRMTGGDGNDIYIVDDAADQIYESANGGVDEVRSSATFWLDAGVEKLTLTGTAAIDGYGSSLNDTLVGNGAANSLRGQGGTDTMTGGAGNDTYFVDNALEKTIEVAGGGIDLVNSSISFTLQSEVENLALTGTGAINGSGNALSNVIVGNSGGNVLYGGGGFDTLTGGTGADTFAFTSTLGSDILTDFRHGTDKIRLSQAAIRVGDGDTVIEGGVSITGPNGFARTAELVIVTHDIAGDITDTSAAAAIGHANSSYAVGDTRLFVVDNGTDSAVYLFKSGDADSTVSASELTLLATLENTSSTTVGDYLFGA